MAEQSIDHTVVSGIHFEKDKSFIAPEFLDELKAVEKRFADWQKDHPRAKVVVFGHTDKDEDDPRHLSARRGEAVFAFVINDFEAWFRISQKEDWGLGIHQSILKAMGFYSGKVDGLDGPKTKAGMQGFQQRAQVEKGLPLAQTGQLDTPTRKALYQVYMSGENRDVKIDSSAFRCIVGQPYMGCSSFNRYQTGDAPHGESRRAVFVLVEDKKHFPVRFP